MDRRKKQLKLKTEKNLKALNNLRESCWELVAVCQGIQDRCVHIKPADFEASLEEKCNTVKMYIDTITANLEIKEKLLSNFV